MSKRSNEKRITREVRVIKFLREQAKISLRQAAIKSGLSMSLVAHMEQGRTGITDSSLKRLLEIYGTTHSTFEMFASGRVELPLDIRSECLELIRSMSLDQLKTAHPVLSSLSLRK